MDNNLIIFFLCKKEMAQSPRPLIFEPFLEYNLQSLNKHGQLLVKKEDESRYKLYAFMHSGPTPYPPSFEYKDNMYDAVGYFRAIVDNHNFSPSVKSTEELLSFKIDGLEPWFKFDLSMAYFQVNFGCEVYEKIDEIKKMIVLELFATDNEKKILCKIDYEYY